MTNENSLSDQTDDDQQSGEFVGNVLHTKTAADATPWDFDHAGSGGYPDGQHVGILSGFVGANFGSGSADDLPASDGHKELRNRLNAVRDDLYQMRDSLPPSPDHVTKETGGVHKMIEDIEVAIDLAERI